MVDRLACNTMLEAFGVNDGKCHITGLKSLMSQKPGAWTSSPQVGNAVDTALYSACDRLIFESSYVL